MHMCLCVAACVFLSVRNNEKSLSVFVCVRAMITHNCVCAFFFDVSFF